MSITSGYEDRGRWNGTTKSATSATSYMNGLSLSERIELGYETEKTGCTWGNSEEDDALILQKY
ncbi:hypothetical protein T265_07834 [Opisthorchis viverrini]|uniref:Uncharacterized protein n=1 Tax=Opisthorchis viverrini TaxID=6198 RepID=A0A074ZFV0_OPIVI|nr:hypothetical protein T265_07834 [Opisthorchis viverrini]KER24522.1 hypothetical protein T265_07834 [Opisthorchis viverrini]